MALLIYTDSARKDVGVLQHADCDFAFGDDENSFVVTLDRKAGLTLDSRSLVYIELSDVGGMITNCDSDTHSLVDTLQYYGLTWTGMLETHVIQPDPGQDYLVVSGEANSVIGSLISKLGIGDLFAASTDNSGITITRHQFNRYVGSYSGIRKMLADNGAKLSIVYSGGKVVLSAKSIVDYSEMNTLDADKIAVKMTKCFLPVNHLVCLGQGDLKDRKVIHLYADEKGNVSQKQTLFGSLENALVYDYSSAEDDELLEEGTKKLEELQRCDSADADFLEDQDYDIGDIIGTYDPITGDLTKAVISKKIVTIDRRGNLNVNYNIGDALTVKGTITVDSGKATPVVHNHSASEITSGTLSIGRIANKSITEAKLADKSVTKAKLADHCVGQDQLESGVWDFISQTQLYNVYGYKKCTVILQPEYNRVALQFTGGQLTYSSKTFSSIQVLLRFAGTLAVEGYNVATAKWESLG